MSKNVVCCADVEFPEEENSSHPSYPVKQVRDNSQAVDRILSKDRIKKLRAIGKKLLRQKHNLDSVIALLVTANETRCDPPLEKAEFSELISELSSMQPDGEKAESDSELPTDLEMATEYVLTHTGTVFGLGGWKKYLSGCYSEIEDIQINKEILKTIASNGKYGIRPTGALMESVKKLVQANVYVPNILWNANPNIIVMKNGVLDLAQWKFLPHNPENYVTRHLDYDFDGNATCPTFHKYLDETLPDVAEFLQEFVGYCLTTDCSHDIAIWLYGPPGCGKSTFIEAVSAVLSDLVGLLSLSRLEKSQFSLGNITGKTLLISNESPARFMTTTDILNRIISGEEVDIERKHVQPMTIRSTSKILWAMNELPRAFAGDGIFRRVKLIRFKHLAAEKRDTTLKSKLIAEKAGILNWALIGLKRLRQRGYFDIPAVVKEASDAYCANNDYIKQFMVENCKIDPEFTSGKANDSDYRAYATYVFSEFERWCKENDYRVPTPATFAEGLARYGVVKTKKSGGMVFMGLRVIRSNEE